MTDLVVSCDCGEFQGVIKGASPKTGTRAKCYCDDCQAFAVFLGKEDSILDAHGGSDIYQTIPARLQITQGHENLACVQVTEKGIFRWYASCCRTPIGNTANSSALPFVGFLTGSLRPRVGEDIDQIIGPVRGAVFTEFARGDLGDVDTTSRRALVLSFLLRTAKAKLSGPQGDNPFFDQAKNPVATPKVVTPEERRELDARLEAMT